MTPPEVSPASTLEEPWAPVSDDPKPSATEALGTMAMSWSFNDGVSGAPPLPIVNSDDTSHGPSLIQASISGRTTGSPTTVSRLTFSRSTVRHTSTPSSDPGRSTTVPPA